MKSGNQIDQVTQDGVQVTTANDLSPSAKRALNKLKMTVDSESVHSRQRHAQAKAERVAEEMARFSAATIVLKTQIVDFKEERGLDNVSPRDFKKINMLYSVMEVARVMSKDLLNNDLHDGKKRLADVVVRSQELIQGLNSPLRRNVAGFKLFKRAIRNIYTDTLGIQSKGFKERQKSSHGLSKERRKNSDQSFKLVEDQLRDFVANIAQHKKAVAIFNHGLKQQHQQLKKMMKTDDSYWAQPDNLIRLIKFLSQDNISRYIKEQINAIQQSKNQDSGDSDKKNKFNYSDALRDYMSQYGFIGHAAEQSIVIGLANSLFEGEQGATLRTVIQEMLASYELHKGLLEVLADTDPVARHQKFDELTATFSNSPRHEPLIARVREQIGHAGPVNSTLLWDFRESLGKENHPIFASLNAKVNALYVSSRKTHHVEPSVVKHKSTMFGATRMAELQKIAAQKPGEPAVREHKRAESIGMTLKVG